MNSERPNCIWLPRTGQTTTSPTANYAAGDDGYFQAGNPRATRFIDNGNGTISDRATGLQWVKDHVAMGSPFDAVMAWTAAPTNIAALNAGAGYAGYHDWRLPNVVEMYSIYDHQASSGSLFYAAFANAKTTGYYHSSTTERTTGQILILKCDRHYATVVATSGTAYVRPVRGGRINANW